LEIHLLLVPSHNTWPHLEFSMQTHPNTEALPIFVSFWSCWILCWDGIIRRTGAFRFSMEGCPLQGAQRDAYTRLDGASVMFLPRSNFTVRFITFIFQQKRVSSQFLLIYITNNVISIFELQSVSELLSHSQKF